MSSKSIAHSIAPINPERSDIAIRVNNLSKCYQIYDAPRDRLKQFVMPRIRRIVGKSHKKYFREFWALKDVSFKIKKGETLGIIGRNGSGKSTLLQMICGTLSPSSGSVETHGRIAALLELGSGFNPEFTGRENVFLNATVLGLSREVVAARFDAIVTFADIGEFIDQPVKTYSSGMYVRLAFAVIAHIDADILVIDEALAVGDTFFTQKCMRFLRKFMESGTVLFVSHDTASIKSFCTHVIWLEKGKVIKEGLPKDVCEAYLEAFYEEQQGKSTTKPGAIKRADSTISIKDRQPEANPQANSRSDIQAFTFDPDAASFGKGGAIISAVYFLDKNANPLSWIVGGETVTLRIEAQLECELDSPIMGFLIKDRLGQTLFGDNTYLAYQESVVTGFAGGMLRASFVFSMPLLPAGDYSVAVAIANGTQQQHELHHWIHDAIIFKSESIRVSNGLIGIPMLELTLEVCHVE